MSFAVASKTFGLAMGVALLGASMVSAPAASAAANPPPVKAEAPTLSAKGSKLEWTEIPDAAKYAVKLTGPAVKDEAPTTTSYDMADLAAGEYTVSVTAKDAGDKDVSYEAKGTATLTKSTKPDKKSKHSYTATFGPDSDKLDAANRKALKKLAKKLKKGDSVKVKIEGNINSSRSTAFGRDLAKNRAEAVKDELKDNGVKGSYDVSVGKPKPLGEKGRVAKVNATVTIKGATTISLTVTQEPAQVPDAPVVTATPNSPQPQGITVKFPFPNDNNSAITKYEYSTNAGEQGEVWNEFTPAGDNVDTLLTVDSNKLNWIDGNTYFVSVRATNSAGTGLSSVPVEVTLANFPDKPVVTAAGQVTPTKGINVKFPFPNDNGSAITKYEYSTNAGDPAEAWHDFTPAGDNVDTLLIEDSAFGAWINGNTYSISVRATNGVGTSAAADAVPVTLANVPGQPVIVVATQVAPTKGINVKFPYPASNGSDITKYQYSTNAGDQVPAWKDFIPTGDNLDTLVTVDSNDVAWIDGNQYSVSVRAINAVGTGPAAAAKPAKFVAPAKPDKPVIQAVAASPGPGLVITFSYPADNGSALTTYDYATDAGTGDTWKPFTPAGDGLPTTLTLDSAGGGWIPGNTYSVSVRVSNSIGTSDAADPVSVMVLPPS